MRNKRCLRGRRWGVRMQTRLRGMASSPFLVGHFLPAAHSTQAVCKPAQQLAGHPNHFPWLQPVRSRGSPGQKSTVQSSPGWQPVVSSSLPLHIWKGSLRKGHTGHFPSAHLGIESSASLCWDREGFAGVIIQSWPRVQGKQKLLPCQREGWLEAATGDEGWAIPWALKLCILVFKFSPRLKLCRHEPFWRASSLASINMNFLCALPWLQAQPLDVLHEADS